MKIWDMRGTLVQTLKSDDRVLCDATWSPNGRRIVIASERELYSEGTTARIWDIETGAIIATLSGHKVGIGTAAWSPDGSRLITGSGDFADALDNTARRGYGMWVIFNGDTAQIWNTKDGTAIVVRRDIRVLSKAPAEVKTATRQLQRQLMEPRESGDPRTGASVAVFLTCGCYRSFVTR
jgi:dipeptidyl aminopeptidase/acylaminoacyl peptidase